MEQYKHDRYQDDSIGDSQDTPATQEQDWVINANRKSLKAVLGLLGRSEEYDKIVQQDQDSSS